MAQQKAKRNPLARVIMGIAVLIAIAGGTWLGMAWAAQQFSPTPITMETLATDDDGFYVPPKAVNEFTLTGTDGEPFTLDDLRGRYTLIAFGYTHCPDVCPLTLTEFKRVKRELSAEQAAQVNFAFVSVDGERDTPDLLANYLSRFDPAFIGITTTNDRLMQETADAFGVYYEKRVIEGTQAAYLVDHTASSFLLNPDGAIIKVYGFGTPPVEIAADLSGKIS